jgi:type I restriction enzyme S subunit
MDGWQDTTLGKLAIYTNGRGFRKTEWTDVGVPIIRIQNLTQTTKKVNYYAGPLEDRHTIRKGDLLLSWAATLDVFEFKEEIGALNQHIFKVEPLDGVNQKFLYYMLKNSLAALYAQTHGSGMVHITSSKFKAIPVKLPTIKEQDKIVSKLEELSSDLEAGDRDANKALLGTKTLRASLLKAAFTGQLPNSSDASESALKTYIAELKGHKQASRAKPTRTRSLDADWGDLPTLPVGWKWEPLANVLSGVEYGSSKKSKKVGRVPVIRMGNIQRGSIDWNNLAFSSDEQEIKKYYLKTGDVLFNRTNSPELVGKSAIYNGEREAIFAGYLIRLNLLPKVNPRFVNYYLESAFAKNYGNRVKTDGVNQSNINGQKLMSYPFPLTDYRTQCMTVQQIESEFSDIDAARDAIAITKVKLASLKQTVLANAFNGELL